MLVVDTGPLVATADTDDAHHAVCRALLEGDDGPLVTTALVVAEAAYLIDRQLGPAGETALYDSIIDGTLRVENLLAPDWERVRELVEQYATLRLGGTDASVIAIADVSMWPRSPRSTTDTSVSCVPPTAMPSTWSPEPCHRLVSCGRSCLNYNPDHAIDDESVLSEAQFLWW